MTPPAQFSSQTLLVVGLAREGLAAARWLAERGARVIVSDVRDAEALAAPLAELKPLGVEARLGPQTPDLLDGVEAVIASPGVPQDIPLFVAARARGIPITTETRMFAQQCPAPIIGVTGSSGKTTTTTLVARMLEAAGFRTWLGGNIGTPLLAELERISLDDRVAMELSSFQLLYWAGQDSAFQPLPWLDPIGVSPAVAGVLNVTPNHLDRHPSMAHYTAAKAQILAHQNAGDVAVLSADDPITAGWASSGRVSIESGPGQDEVEFSLKGRVSTFSLSQEPKGSGAWIDAEGRIMLRWPDRNQMILPISEIKLRGEHNLSNVLAACCLAAAASAPPEALAAAIRSFSGVAGRLELVRERAGVIWINDSIATSPERALAAIRSFDEPLILLAGGRDKHLPWQAWAAEVHRRVRHVITFGEAADLIAEALSPAPAGSRLLGIHAGGDLPGAVALASKLARAGDVALLSPGGTSFDAYVDFAARGAHFRELI